jgi:hypothetical protein
MKDMVQALLTEPILEGMGFAVSANSSIMDEGAFVKKSFIIEGRFIPTRLY